MSDESLSLLNIISFTKTLFLFGRCPIFLNFCSVLALCPLGLYFHFVSNWHSTSEFCCLLTRFRSLFPFPSAVFTFSLPELFPGTFVSSSAVLSPQNQHNDTAWRMAAESEPGKQVTAYYRDRPLPSSHETQFVSICPANLV